MSRSIDEAALRCQRIAQAYAAWEPLWAKVTKHVAMCEKCKWVSCEDESQDHQVYCGQAPPRPPIPDWAAL